MKVKKKYKRYNKIYSSFKDTKQVAKFDRVLDRTKRQAATEFKPDGAIDSIHNPKFKLVEAATPTVNFGLLTKTEPKKKKADDQDVKASLRKSFSQDQSKDELTASLTKFPCSHLVNKIDRLEKKVKQYKSSMHNLRTLTEEQDKPSPDHS